MTDDTRSARAIEDRRLLGRIKQSWLESRSVYGYHKVHDDLREIGESCGRHRVARLMRLEGVRAQRGYRPQGQHEPTWQLPRQRRRRELLPAPQA